jgi:signal transduction histidine kinase
MGDREGSTPGGTRIVVWFALTSFVVFALVGVAISVSRARDVRAREERAAGRSAELCAAAVIGPLLVPSDFAGPITGTRYEAIDDRVATAIDADPGIVRVKIWSLDGTVLYSNDRTQVGEGSELDEDLREATEGEVANEISNLTAEENASERKLASKLFETYVPFRFGPDEPVAGVIEVYRDYSTIQTEIDHLTRTLTMSLVVGLLVLYVVMLPMMIGMTRLLRRQTQTVAELRKLDRLKSDFVAAASHELRTPITSIVGYLHLLRQTPAARDPGADEAITAIERQSGRLRRMISNVLRESQLEEDPAEGPATTFAFDELVREASGDFNEAGSRIVNRVPDDLPPVTCDRRRIGDVLTNLLDNALKYSTAPAPVTVGADVRDGTLLFWVEDEGIGITSGELPRIFDRFYQADQSATRSYSGVGLGLHIVQKFVEAMKGTIEVRSEPGSGSTFVVSVPLVGSAADGRAAVAGSSLG